jgi:hypothetical protein
MQTYIYLPLNYQTNLSKQDLSNCLKITMWPMVVIVQTKFGAFNFLLYQGVPFCIQFVNEIIVDAGQAGREKLCKFYCELSMTLNHLRQTED